jgi:hypothetical protein
LKLPFGNFRLKVSIDAGRKTEVAAHASPQAPDCGANR